MNCFPGRPGFSRIHRLQWGAVISLAGLLTSFGGNANPQQSTSPAPITRSLTAGDSHEECLLVREGNSVRYDFTATAALEFDVHHHGNEPGNVTYLFGPEVVDSTPERNFHTLRESKIICLLWSNKQSTPVELNYSLSTLDPDGQGEP